MQGRVLNILNIPISVIRYHLCSYLSLVDIQKLSGSCKRFWFLSNLVDPVFRKSYKISEAIELASFKGLNETLYFLLKYKKDFVLTHSEFSEMARQAAKGKQKDMCVFIVKTIREECVLEDRNFKYHIDDCNEYFTRGAGYAGDIEYAKWIFDTFIVERNRQDELYFWWNVLEGACSNLCPDLAKWVFETHGCLEDRLLNTAGVLINAASESLYDDDFQDRAHKFQDLWFQFIRKKLREFDVEALLCEHISNLEEDHFRVITFLYEKYENLLGYEFFTVVLEASFSYFCWDVAVWITTKSIMHRLLTNKRFDISKLEDYVKEKKKRMLYVKWLSEQYVQPLQKIEDEIKILKN